MAVSTLVRHRFLSRSLHTLHETHNDHRGDGVTTPPLHTPCLFLIFGVALLPRRCRRAHRGDGLKHSRGTREARAAVTWKACHWQRWVKRSRGTCRRVKPAMPIYAPLSSGGAAGHGCQPHAGCQSGRGPRAPAGAGLGRSTDAGFGASYGSPLGADPRTACMTSVCD